MTDKEAMKLALGQLQAGFVGNAMQILREALADPMREVQRLGQEIEQEPSSVQQAYAMAQVCLDLHDAIGCKWGDNVYFAIDQLKAVAQPPQRTEPVACERCKQLEEHAYDLVGQLRVANIKLSMLKEKT